MDTRLLDRICGSFRARLKALLMQAGVARMSILAVAFLPPFMVLDWWIHLTTVWRLLALLIYLAGLGAIGWWTLMRPLARSWSNLEVLTYVDSVAPDGKGMLLDLYELIKGEGIQETESKNGQALAEAAVEDLTPLAQQVRLTEAFERRKAWRWMSTSAVMLALAAVLGMAMGEYTLIGLERFFNPFSRQRWPHRTTITVEEPEHGWTVAQMEEFKVQAVVSGEVPPQVLLVYRSETTGFDIKDRLPVGNEGQVLIRFPEVREPLTFKVIGGDYTTDSYELKIIERPYLKKITASYVYPDYAGLPPKEAAGGQLMGLEGTQVKLEFECSLPLKKAVFALDSKPPEEMTLITSTTFEKSLMLEKDGSYSIELYDPNGFREPKPEKYEIRVIEDKLPEVEMLGQDIIATKNVSVDVVYKARDDFGLKKVELLYQLNDGPPKPLSDRVTGDIKQDGKLSQGRFTWDLRKMDTLPESGNITYYLQAQDINPTGRGKVPSQQLHIKLVKPSEFHREALESANGLITEAFLAWKNQGSPGPKEMGAYQLAGQWLKSGTGKDDDPIWKDMKDKQEAAMRAASAMKNFLQTLITQYESNHMEREFMSKRLGQIAELLKQLSDKEYSAIHDGLRQSKPPTEADAAPDRLKSRRSEALGKFNANQKMAVLILERILRKAYDWRDLQTTTITTTLLCEDQEEVTSTTEKIAPKYIGKEFEDLSDEQQEQLVTLGKQQRAKFDTETQLETQLIQLTFKAEKQKRKSILLPLRTAFEGLRTNRVNDNLKESANKIENNEMSVIIKKQKAALSALTTVKGGLVIAGQKVDDKEEQLTADTAMSTQGDFEEIKVAKEEDKPEGELASANVPAMSKEVLEEALKEGTDQVSKGIRDALEEQDWVLSRTRYLGGDWDIKPIKDMPRHWRLKLGRLLERQGDALLALDRAMLEASKPPTPPAKEEAARPKVKEVLVYVKDEFKQAESLLTAKDVSGCVQQIEADSIATLNDLLQYISFEKSAEDAIKENRDRNGEDAFKRKFLLRDKDLDAGASIIADTNQAKILEKDVLRKINRFVKAPPQSPKATEIEKVNRTRAADGEKRVSDLMVNVVGKGATLSAGVAPRVKEAGLQALLDLKVSTRIADVGSGAKDKDLAPALEEDLRVMVGSLQSLRDLLEEREKPPVVIAKAVEKPTGPTAEEYAKANSAKAIADRIKAASGIPQDLRDKMAQSLEREFPPKYKELLLRYYASVIPAENKP